MRFMDELRGSEGERCTVADLRSGIVWSGTVEALNEANGKVHVRDDEGTLMSVGYSFVTLTEPETVSA